ncbi:MAG: hypothetical protein FWE98_07575 [Oscillospiraceae bacterium]|nr:hypothetical protein [Oscillospiraceae bacterium]
MPFWKTILVWLMTGLIAVAAFFCNLFGIDPPEMPGCLTTTAVTAVAEPVEVWTWSFTRGEVIALAEEYDFDVVEQESVQIPQPQGDPRHRIYTGIRLRDLLAHFGIDVDALGDNAYLRVEDSPDENNRGGFATDYSIALIRAEDTLLAWHEVFVIDGSEEDVIRMCPIYGPAFQFVKDVDTLTLYA